MHSLYIMLFEMMSNITGLGWGGLANTLNSFDSRDSLFIYKNIYILQHTCILSKIFHNIDVFGICGSRRVTDVIELSK